MVKRSGLILLVLMGIISAYGQNERKVIRDGVRAYENEEFGEAEVQFRKAENINQDSYEAEFNTGAALYGQEKYEETVKQYQSLLDHTDDAGKTARIWHNIGNSLLEAQQYAPSIEAYKNSLRLNPSDEDTRYNLAYAKQKLNEQQQQNQDQEQDKDQEQQDQDQDKDQDQDQNKDQDQDQNKDQKLDQGDDQQDRQDQQPVPQEISKEDAERMLKAIQQQEKDVKEKVDKKKAAAAKVKTEKDW
ncbi:MAG: tetratricopeptide repeat protein [Bacteroidetes bacterium]|nr:tetratricopeptide repeat protein [Bacteroidota bacterium]